MVKRLLVNLRGLEKSFFFKFGLSLKKKNKKLFHLVLFLRLHLKKYEKLKNLTLNLLIISFIILKLIMINFILV